MQDLIDRFNLSEDQLDTEVSDEYLREVARIIDNHEILGYDLGLTKPEMTAVDRDAKPHELKKIETLKRWKEKYAWKATYRKLVEALLECHKADCATQVCELLNDSKCF